MSDQITYRAEKGTPINIAEYDSSLRYLDTAIKAVTETTPIVTVSNAWPIGAMNIRAYATNYPILDAIYTAVVRDLTLRTLNESTGDANYSANNPTHIRRDAVVADAQGNIIVIEGTPGTVSSYPEIEPALYFFIRDMVVTATSEIVDGETGTTSNVTKVLYKENEGEPNEAEVTATHSSIVPGSTSNPITPNKSIEATNCQRMHKVLFTFSSVQSTSGATHLRLKTKLKAILTSGYWFLGFLNNGQRVHISNNNWWYLWGNNKNGFDAQNTTDAQEMLVSLSDAAAVDIEFTQMELFLYHNKTVFPGYWLDDIEFINGLADNPNNPPSANHTHNNKSILDQLTSEHITLLSKLGFDPSVWDGNLAPTDDTLQKVLDKLDGIQTSQNLYLGYFTDEDALTTAHPTALNGNYTVLGSTDTVWIWDTDTNNWLNSGSTPSISPDSIGLPELKAELKARVDMGTGTAIDWQSGISFTHDKLTANITLTDSNLPQGTDTKTITLDVDLDTFSLTFPVYYIFKGGDTSVSGKTRIVIDCVNGNSSSEEVYYTLIPNA